MAAIPVDFGDGGAHLSSFTTLSLAGALRDIADDLAGLQQPALTATAATTVAGADADVTYGAEERDLINEIKASVNELVTLTTEMRTDMNASAGHTILTTKA